MPVDEGRIGAMAGQANQQQDERDEADDRSRPRADNENRPGSVRTARSPDGVPAGERRAVWPLAVIALGLVLMAAWVGLIGYGLIHAALGLIAR